MVPSIISVSIKATISPKITVPTVPPVVSWWWRIGSVIQLQRWLWSTIFARCSSYQVVQIIASPHIWYHILKCHVSRVSTMYLTIVFAITLGHHCQTPIMSKIHYDITVSGKVTQLSAYMTISVPRITCCPQQF